MTSRRRCYMLSIAALCTQIMGFAQTDPVLMTINGKDVLRSEFEYSYNKNNTESVVDKKTLKEYVPLFVNYKLKVEAAIEAGIDTTKAFKTEFLGYRNQQIRPHFITDEDVEREAWSIYKSTQERIDSTGGLVRPAHILIVMKQKATDEQQKAAKQRVDSIYNALKNGADFAELAAKCSDDKAAAERKGDIGWIQKGQTLKEFEDQVFALKKGDLSAPFLSPVGYHIVKLLDKGNFFPYDSVHADIIRFIDQRNLREKIITQNIDSIAKLSTPPITSDEVLDRKTAELEAQDDDLKNLIKEYHDGLLLYEISNRTVWEKAASDEQALEKYFKKNKKRYSWDAPRFKGIAYYTKNDEDKQAVVDAIKNVPFKDWGETLRKEFNDSIVRVQVVKGIFKQGDNATVDKEVFKKDTLDTQHKDFPVSAIYGEELEAPQSYDDVKDLVVSDYQESLESQWIKALRKRYKVKINKQVLATVNNH